MTSPAVPSKPAEILHKAEVLHKEVLHKIVPIEKIQEDPGIQVRIALDPAIVSEYAALIAAHGEMDPLDLFYESLDQDQFLLSEGHHRLAAYRQAGATKVKCRLRQGTRSDALEYAAYRNARHGVRLTNADKRRAAQLAVEDPVMGELTDAEIAGRICVSPSLVGEVRRGRTPEARRQAPAQVPQAQPESESTAPREVTVRERKNATGPTSATPAKRGKAALLKQIQSWLDEEDLTEDDLCDLMETKRSRPFAVAKPGEIFKLKVIAKNYREQVFIPVVAKDWAADVVVVKFEDGKLTVE